MALIFDTETTGLPTCAYYSHFPHYTQLDKYSNARIVQVSYIHTDSEYNIITESDTIINTDAEINNSQFHGITQEIAETNGVLFIQWASDFMKVLKQVDILIAHNINFDINVLKSELYRYSFLDIIEEINYKTIICTMKFCKNLVCAKFKNSDNIKDPNLKELYKYTTGKNMENHHNSFYDTSNLHSIIQILYKSGRFDVC